MEQYFEEFEKSRLVIYTAIIGNYDVLKTPEFIDENCDYICFTDNRELVSDIWQIRLVERTGLDASRHQRMFKVLPHRFLAEYQYSVYIDGNVRIIGSFRDFVRRQWKGASLLGLKHPDRDNIYDEAEECINLNKDNPELIRRQIGRYKREGYKADNGLTVNNVIFRRHKDQKLIKVMEDWWKEIRDNSGRDQLSFCYVCWKNHFAFDVSDLKCYRSEYWLNPGIHTNNIRDVENALIDHIQLAEYYRYLINEKDKCIALKEREKENEFVLDGNISEKFAKIEEKMKNDFDWLNYRIDDLVYEKILLEKKIEHNYLKNLTESELIYELKRWYYLKTGKKLDLENPRTFDEKIQWMKMYDHNPLKRRLADKVRVREYVQNEIGMSYLIPVIGVYDFFDQIDFGNLPAQFVLKCSHGSGWNEIVKDKSRMDIPKIKRNFDYWMSLDYAFYSGFEMHYRNMDRKILIEQFMGQPDGDLYDYKIHCFMGVPKFIQVIGDRNVYDHTAKEAFYDTDWQRLDMHMGDFPLYGSAVPKPTGLDEMLAVADKLSKPFGYVRIDLYEIGGQVKFGEFTFTPNSGIHQLYPQDLGYRLGDLFALDIQGQ